MHARVKIALGTLALLIAARLTVGAFQTRPGDELAAPSARALAPAGQIPASPCPASSLPDHGVCVPVPAGDAEEPEATGAAGR